MRLFPFDSLWFLSSLKCFSFFPIKIRFQEESESKLLHTSSHLWRSTPFSSVEQKNLYLREIPVGGDCLPDLTALLALGGPSALLSSLPHTPTPRHPESKIIFISKTAQNFMESSEWCSEFRKRPQRSSNPARESLYHKVLLVIAKPD